MFQQPFSFFFLRKSVTLNIQIPFSKYKQHGRLRDPSDIGKNRIFLILCFFLYGIVHLLIGRKHSMDLTANRAKHRSQCIIYRQSLLQSSRILAQGF